jgi:nucleoside diphosphate kinase
MDKTLLLIKPTALDSEHQIISQLKQNGFKISQVSRHKEKEDAGIKRQSGHQETRKV